MRSHRIPVYFLSIAIAAVLLPQSTSADLNCTFNDAGISPCLDKSLSIDKLQWTIMKASATPGQDLPKVDGDGTADGGYAFLEIKGSVKARDFALMKTPLLKTDDDVKCVNFQYFLFGTRIARLQLFRNCYSNSSNPDLATKGEVIVWQTDGKSQVNLGWNTVMVHIAPDPADQCELFYRAELTGDGFHGIVAIDNIVGGECFPIYEPPYCTFETPCPSWVPIDPTDPGRPPTLWTNTTATTWTLATPADIPPLAADHSSMSVEGGVYGLIAPDGGCYSAQMVEPVGGQLDPKQPNYCMRFYAKAVRKQGAAMEPVENTAAVYIHLLRMEGGEDATIISTPWVGRLSMDGSDHSWHAMHAYLDMSWLRYLGIDSETSRATVRFVVEGRFCSPAGGGIAIDELSTLSVVEEKHCRLPGDEDFENTMPFWEPIDMATTGSSWIVLPSVHSTTFLQSQFYDHTFASNKLGNYYATEEDYNAVTRMRSGGTLDPTHARCVSFWMLIKDTASKLAVRVEPVSVDGVLPNEKAKDVYIIGTHYGAQSQWLFHSFSYYSRSYHKLIVEATGGFMIDDFTFTDGVCSCKPDPIAADKCHTPDFNWAINWLPTEVDKFYSRIGDCQADNLAVYKDVSLAECAYDCDTSGPGEEEGCLAFVYSHLARTCELKKARCPNVVSDSSKRTYERKKLNNYFSIKGECTAPADQTFGGMASPQACADKCDADSNCGTFVYAPVGGSCFLHYNPCTWKQHNDHETYEKIEFKGFMMFSGSCDLSGQKFRYNGITRRKCHDICRANSTCATFIYDSSRSTCDIASDKTCASKPEHVMNTFTYIKTAIVDLSCDFEDVDMTGPGCSSWNMLPGGINFTLVSSQLGYGMNGPRRDITLHEDDKGHYLLLPYASSADGDDDEPNTANFVSDLISPNMAGCLSFWHYMFGPSIGRLAVYIVEEEQLERGPTWRRVGSQGDMWVDSRINLADLGIKKNFKILFEADIGSGLKSYLGGIALDDIVISPHACIPTTPSICSFEGHDGCVIVTQTGFSKVQPVTLAANEGPKMDRTYHSGLGHVILASNVQKKAVFSIRHDSRHERCAVLWYQRGSKCMQLHAGLTDGQLRFRELLAPSASEPGRTEAPEDVSEWWRAYMNIPAFGKTDAIIEFHAEPAADQTGCPSNTNWLAIDEIVVLQNGCPRASVCNFESPTCSYWMGDSFSADNTPWLHGMAPGLSRIPSPQQDNTLSYIGVGGYTFIDQLVHRDDIPKTSLLKSQWIQGFALPTTISFYYYITGPESGILEVYMLTESDIGSGKKDPTMIWHIGSQERESNWKFARISINPMTDLFQLTFKAARGTNSYALLAVDDIVVQEGVSGSLYPPEADPTFPLTTRQPITTTTPVTPYPTFAPGTEIFKCDFEKDTCSFKSVTSNTWARACGNGAGCPASSKGPIFDHTTGKANGYYYYVSLNSRTTITAELGRQYTLEKDKKYCLSFWYYAEGSKVELITSGTDSVTTGFLTTFWRRDTAQGPQWNYVEYTMSATGNQKSLIFFSGYRSPRAGGTFAIDDVVFVPGACPRRDMECNFEDDSATPCGSVPTPPIGNVQWNFGYASSNYDHTLQTYKGHYAYVSDTSRKNNFTTQLSQPYSRGASSQYCLQLWYRLGPDPVSGMDVCVDDCTNGLFLSGLPHTTAKNWAFAEHDFSARRPDQFNLIFQARYGFSGSLTPAAQLFHIDDVKLLPGKCENPDKCDFEQGLCGWTNDETNSQFDWLLGSGAYRGPVALDNTLGASEGHYVFAPLNPPRKRGDVARFISPTKLSSSKGCLRFFFWSFAPTWRDASSLTVIAVTNSGERSIWYTKDRANAKWQAATAPIDLSGLPDDSFQIVFEAMFDSDEYGGAMAIDDVNFDTSSPGCKLTPGGNEPSYLATEIVTCPFEDGSLCLWQPVGDDDFQWAVTSDPMDSTPAATVQYKIQRDNIRTSLMTPQAPGSGKYCFEFKYAFHGSYPGTFSIGLKSGSSTKTIYARTGSQGYKYRYATVPIAVEYDFYLSFDVSGASSSNDTKWSGTLSLRSAKLFTGDCPAILDDFCDFEKSLCDWEPQGSGQWKLASGGLLQEPQVDHTTGTWYGNYAAIKGSTSGKDSFLKRTTGMKPTADQCLTFWYYIDNQTPGLSVYGDYVRTSGSAKRVTLWQRTVTTSGRWDKAFARVPRETTSFYRVELRFVGKTTLENNVVAIDDVYVATGTCPEPMACDWEETTCGYQQTDPTKASMIWTSAGSTDTSPNAPKADYSKGSPYGHYLFVGAESVQDMDAQMESSLSGPYPTEGCIEVWYQLSGRMSFRLKSTEGSEGREDAPTYGAWRVTRIKVSPAETFRLAMTVRRGEGAYDPTGFVAIDDVRFREDTTCESLGPSTPFPTTIPTTQKPVAGFSCDFELDFCGWQSDNSTQFEFARTSGRATSSGPDGDVSGTGYYIYLGSSWSAPENGSARILSPMITQEMDGTPYCFQFWYYLNGEHVDRLSLYEADNYDLSERTFLWSRSKEQGNKWIRGHVELNSTFGPGHRLIFSAVKRTGAYGVIALDDLTLRPGACPPFMSCDFEDHKMCGWVNDPKAKDDWQLVQGKDGAQFGPRYDHTYDTSYGSFIHVGQKDKGYHYARLLSQEHSLSPSTVAGCVRLWIFTDGQSPNFVINIIPTDNGIDLEDQAKAIFSMAYTPPVSSAKWRRVSARVEHTGTFRIALESTGDFGQGGISVDDLELNVFRECGMPAMCDFENGQCGWQNNKANYYDWTDHRGPTETPGTGPDVDHTFGTADGSYMYLESSQSYIPSYGRTSIFESEYISSWAYPQSRACFRFWYHMYGGTGMGSLDVLQEATGDQSYWTASGNQGNEWLRGLVDIDLSSSKPLVIQIRGTFGERGQSDLAIDDTVLLPGDCTQYNTTIDPHQVFNCSRPLPDGKISIPLRKRCNFVPDCPDAEDELDCGFSCDFDSSPENCSWVPLVSKVSDQMWDWGHGNENKTQNIGPELDHTTNSAAGGYEFIALNPQGYRAERTDFLLRVSPTADTCWLSFWYNIYGPYSAYYGWGDIRVTLTVGDNRFDIGEVDGKGQGTVSNWRYYSTKLGRIHTDFGLMLRGYKVQSSAGVLAIDDLFLENCSFPMPRRRPCDDETQFRCVISGACIPRSAVCDLADDCGDNSDEADCSKLPMYCNFETDTCGLITQSGSWYRSSNSGMSLSPYYPARDHTTGLYYGYSLYSSYNWGESVVRLKSTYYLKDKSTCAIRFFYQLGSYSILKVNLLRESDGTSTTYGTYTGSTDGTWVKVELGLASFGPKDAFAVEFLAVSSGSTFAAIDDVTMTSDCYLNDESVCLWPEYFRCQSAEGSDVPGPCLPSSYVGDFTVDCPRGDDEYGYGPCTFEPLGTATEGSTCKWNMSQTDGFQVLQTPFKSAYDPKTDGPPTLNSKGWYLHADSKTIFDDPVFTLSSPPLPAMGSRCSMKMAFWINGQNDTETVTLTYKIKAPTATDFTTVGAETIKVYGSWQTTKPVSFGQSYPANSIISVEVFPNHIRHRNEAVLGIDNIAFEDCSVSRGIPDLTCSFDDGTTCAWTMKEDEWNYKVYWWFGDGTQASTKGGPGTPYGGSGKYLFITEKSSGYTFYPAYAELNSPIYAPSKDPFCLQFAYHVFGPQPGALRAYIGAKDSYYATEIFSRETSQGNQWRVAHLTISPQKNRYNLQFVGTSYGDYKGHIAIDDIRILRGECDTRHTVCDFETNQCGWETTATDPYDFTFTRLRRDYYYHANTSSPQIDHTTEGKSGYFMLMEADERRQGDRAGLVSPIYPVPRGAIQKNCFRFWYHMLGKDMGQLTVNVFPTNKRRVAFSRTGNHGNHWWEGKIEIKTTDFSYSQQNGNFRVAIEGVVGQTALSDIAIDDVSLTNGSCSLPATCDFEHTQCGWGNVYEVAQVNWLRNNNATVSRYSGPSTDHTYGNASGYYMFIDSSSQSTASAARRAYYASEIIQGNPRGHCFTFWYHMSGTAVGTLSVQLLYPTHMPWENITIWSLSGNQSDYWQQGKVNIFTSEEYSVVFVANMTAVPGGGDIAIDDLALDQTGPCPDVSTPRPTPAPEMFLPCGFEQSTCGWTSVNPPAEPNMGWLRASGSHPVTKDAPQADHTRLDQSGHYLASYPNNTNSSAYMYKSLTTVATSSYFWTTNRHCLVTFYYYFPSSLSTGNQRLEFGIRPFNSPDLILYNPWSIQGKSNTWNSITAEVGQQGKTFQFYLKHSISYTYSMPGMIAFDDFTYIDCNAPAPQASCPSYEFRCDNGACISKSLLCDGTDNCGDYSDESRSPQGACWDRIVVTFENKAYDSYYTFVAPIGYANGEVTMPWAMNSGSTPSSDTGPRFDHTFANSSGHYYYLEASDYQKYNKAWLIMNATLSGSQSKDCSVRFHYHMYGKAIGTLTTYTRTEIDGPLTKKWQRSGEVGDFWLSATISLSDIKTDYQIIFEGETTDSYEGDLALDDISFTEGCRLSDIKILPNYTTLSPMPSTTPAPCPTNSTLFSCYKSSPNFPCINRNYVCNFVKDCPAGEDEMPPMCTQNPTIFDQYSTLEASSWESLPVDPKSYRWNLRDPKNLPRTCQGTCPTTDAKGGTGKYAAADSTTSTSSSAATILTQKFPGLMAGPQCQVSFYAYVYAKSYSSAGSLNAFLMVPADGGFVPVRLWATSVSYNGWQQVTAPIGLQTAPFYIQFEAKPLGYYGYVSVAAVDRITFENCETIEPQATCGADKFRCTGSGGCIEPKLKCDFADHCGDGNPNDVSSSSDEKLSLCDTSYARCAFDEPAIDCELWGHDVVAASAKWRDTEARFSYSYNMPETDHTTRKPTGHILLLNHEYSYYGATARYHSTKRFMTTNVDDQCHIRFWLFFFSPTNDIGQLYILKRTAYVPLTEIYLANYTQHLAGVWVRQDINIPVEAGKPFEIVFYGVMGRSPYGGAIAIDDISMTPECHVTNIFLPGQETITTTTFAPSCDEEKGSYKCTNSSGCYTLAQHCDFINECEDGSDEADCSKSCTFDSEKDWCNWKKSPDYKQDWKWSNYVSQWPYQGPKGDHTTGKGGYLQSTGGYTKGDRARLVSTVFQRAAPGCIMQFWYYAYTGTASPGVSSIHVSVKSGKSGITEYFNQPQIERDENWRYANVTIYSAESFEVRIDVNYGGSNGIPMAIDDLEFINCSPDSPPATCLNPLDFLCEDASLCIPQSKVCDFKADCRDGSDENEKMCRAERAPGSCAFENLNWQKFCGLEGNVTGDLLAWQGATADAIRNGPVIDHTLNTGKGRVVYVDTTSVDVGFLETATLATTAIFPAISSICHYRFYYYFYRAKSSRGLGKLKVMTLGNETNTLTLRTQFTMLNIDPGSSTKDVFGDTWVPVNVPIRGDQPYRIFLIAEIDDNPLSVMAVDDLSLSSTCLTYRPPVSNVTGCPVDEVLCSGANTCIPTRFVCDSECDCPSCTDEQFCTSEPTTLPPTDLTTPETNPPTTPETSGETTAEEPTPEQTTAGTGPTAVTATTEQPTTKKGEDIPSPVDVGMVLGIVFGILAVVIGGGVGAFFYYRRRTSPPPAALSLAPGAGIANPIYERAGPATTTGEQQAPVTVLLQDMPTTQTSSNDAIIDSTVSGDL